MEGAFSPEALKVSIVGGWNHNVVTQWVLEDKSPNRKAEEGGVERLPVVLCPVRGYCLCHGSDGGLLQLWLAAEFTQLWSNRHWPSAGTTSASQSTTAGSLASFQWKKKNQSGRWDFYIIAKTLHINFIYRKMYAVVKTDGARTTLCWFAALLLTSLIGVISIIPFK